MPKISHILITGMPGCGKTTLIKRIAADIKRPYSGFFTNEIRTQGVRSGFEIDTFSGKKGILAHTNIKSSQRVSKYGVDVDAFEKMALPEIEGSMQTGSLLIIDEIGKMELFSTKFKLQLVEIFKSDMQLLATIMYKPEPFCNKLKAMPGTELLVLEQGNHEEVQKTILNLLKE